MRPWGRKATFLALVCALTGGTVFAISPEAVSIELDYVGSFGRGPSNAPGSMNGPSAVAVDSNGDVYTISVGFARVERYEGDATYITHWSTGSARGIAAFDGLVYTASQLQLAAPSVAQSRCADAMERTADEKTPGPAEEGRSTKMTECGR
jgi:hypothetical protein